ncbi:solute carrier family 23 protein [Piscibacillus salipiscarius]|uniref:solute carrier family 23 protein n=1 Tax=Piscibacillus salipiscarius TaxID=299480 RepID=UPI0034E195B7
MGVNVLFTFSIVQQYEFTYAEGLGIVVVSSLIFLITAITPLGESFKQAVPDSLKHGITIGLGLFLVLIGLENGGLIVSGDYSIITLGDFSSPTVIVSLLSLTVGIVLFVKNVPANFLITMIVGTWIASMFGILEKGKGEHLSVDGITDLFILPDFGHIGELAFWIAVLPLSIVLIFESMGLIHGQLNMLNRSEAFKSTNRSSAVSALLSGFLELHQPFQLLKQLQSLHLKVALELQALLQGFYSY